MKNRAGAYSADKLIEAIGKAERKFKRRPDNEEQFVSLLPSEVQIQPVLFQPREFSFGLRATDEDHVKKLARAIEAQGELDPIVVIKVGNNFVCVEGQHRLEAYETAKWKQPIKCEWFAGTVREAVDESIRRNAKDRRNLAQADRLEAAWKRVLLNWGSKADIVRLCVVADGTVAHMRRVRELWREKSERGKEFRRSLAGRRLEEISWTQARLAYLNVEPKEIDDELRAERLAKRIRERLEDLLSRDAGITARASELYDPKLPQELREAWGKPNPVTVAAEKSEAAEKPEEEVMH